MGSFRHSLNLSIHFCSLSLSLVHLLLCLFLSLLSRRNGGSIGRFWFGLICSFVRGNNELVIGKGEGVFFPLFALLSLSRPYLTKPIKRSSNKLFLCHVFFPKWVGFWEFGKKGEWVSSLSLSVSLEARRGEVLISLDCFCFSLTFSFSPFLAFFFSPLSLSLSCRETS